ncbi:MAG: hypothetical protein FWC97_12295 [Treponema sp.]|nr:hypothetical protein [Treponema sp.]
MKVQGSDCSIVIKTARTEIDVPYSEETLREAVCLLQEEAAIEGSGICKAIRKSGGATGCIITPLTIGTAPVLLYLAMGFAENPVFVSGARNLYRYSLNLLPMEDTERFDLIQDRGGEQRRYEACRIKGFELRIMRGEAVKLKLDILGERSPKICQYNRSFVEKSAKNGFAERFYGDCVTYRINGQEYKNIYGITLVSKKEGGTKTEVWIKREAVRNTARENSSDLLNVIDELIISATLLRDRYEQRQFGSFWLTLKRLVLTSDETSINSTDTVIGPLRYYVSDTVTANVYIAGKEWLA